MANTIKPKRSYTTTNVPTLASGELGINATDGKMWIGNAAGNTSVLVSSLALSDHTGTLTVANGGTGLTSSGTSGNVLTSNGTTWASTAAASGGMPTGVIMPFAGASAPSGGYLLCDGSSVSSSTYLALHAVISNTYGGLSYTGAAGRSFNLPDLRSRVPVGVGQGSGLSNRTLGGTVGTETFALAASNIPSITTGTQSANHTHSGTTDNQNASHYHQNYSDGIANGTMGRGAYGFNTTGGGYQGYLVVGAGANGVSTSFTGYQQGAHGHTFGTGSNNANHSHTYTNASPTAISNIQPSIGLNYIIKT